MSVRPPDPPDALAERSEQAFCYGHPNTPTNLFCSRCGRPICHRCAIPAAVGQHCPECVAEARRNARRVRSVAFATAPAVFGILAFNAIVFVLQQVLPAPGPFDLLTRYFALYQPDIYRGEWYRLVTPMFLHAGILHIALNSMALYFIGPNVEYAYGSRRFVAMYLITGFTGGVASYAFGTCPEVGVGASGAIFGILGVLLAYVYTRRRVAAMRQYLSNILVIIVLNLVLGFSIPNIDLAAHTGGLIGGVALGVGLDPDAGRGMRQVLTVVAVIAVAIAVVAWRTAGFPPSCLHPAL